MGSQGWAARGNSQRRATGGWTASGGQPGAACAIRGGQPKVATRGGQPKAAVRGGQSGGQGGQGYFELGVNSLYPHSRGDWGCARPLPTLATRTNWGQVGGHTLQYEYVFLYPGPVAVCLGSCLMEVRNANTSPPEDPVAKWEALTKGRQAHQHNVRRLGKEIKDLENIFAYPRRLVINQAYVMVCAQGG